MEWVTIIGAVIGAGGITALVNAIKDYRAGKAQHEEQVATREADAEERLIVRLERRIEELERVRDADAVYIARLVTALGRAGIDVPTRD